MNDNNKNKIVKLSDVIEQKLKKEKEVAYFKHQIAILNVKLLETQKELDITTLIVNLIEEDNIVDFVKFKDKYIE